MKYLFQVQGMSCGHCEKAIAQALKRIDPHADVYIDRPNGKVEVNSDSPQEKLAQAIKEEGYTVSV